MKLIEALKAMAVKELQEARPDLEIRDAAPIQEARESLQESIDALDVTDEDKATAKATLSPAEADPIADLVTGFLSDLDEADIDEDARKALSAMVRDKAPELGVELPAAEEAEPEEAEEPTPEVAEESEPEPDETPEPGVAEQVGNLRKLDRALDKALADTDAPGPVREEIRESALSQIDEGQLSTSEAITAFVTEQVTASKRSAESWRAEINGVEEPDESRATEADARKATTDALKKAL